MSAFTDAWSELYAAQTEAQGTSPKLAILNDSNISCIIGEDQDDPAFYGGGIASGGQMTVQCIMASLTARPAKNDTATITGMASNSGTYVAQVINTTERNGILYMSLGDNTTT